MISFDLGNTLETERPLQAMVRYLAACGEEVVIISAIGRLKEDALRRIRALCLPIPEENIHFVQWKAQPGERPTIEAMYDAGVEKGRIANRLGVTVHFDDSSVVVAGMRSVGAPAVQIVSSVK